MVIMKRYVWIAAAVLALGVPALSRGQPVYTQPPYVPKLADIMELTQFRHIKLWYAGRQKNWTLANYELGRIKASFDDAMRFYPSLPTADMTTMAAPANAIGTAIEAKDVAKFATAFNQLTAACNACHTSQGVGFLVIKVPNLSPFSNESFPPK